MQRLGKEFFSHDDVVQISRSLLGKVLCSNFDGVTTAGIIVETEAYKAPEDKASHAYNNRRTSRTEIMFGRPGLAYIYLCYGIHHLFNVITGAENQPHAVLIRAIEPTTGLDKMLRRRGMKKLEPRITAGPGSLSTAMGFHKRQTGIDLCDAASAIWIEDHGNVLSADDIVASPRVGVGYAEECAEWPWRFRLRGNAFTSPAK